MENKREVFEEGLVSVVMSNFNTPVTYLKEAIDSVLEQTYTNFEFIIIDDGSTDNSADIIESYSDKRIKLIRNETNMGLTPSLNKGLEICRGEYVARMDSDDICHPERFSEQVSYLKENPDVIVCGTFVESIDDGGQTVRKKGERNIIPDMDYYRICLLFSNDPTIYHPSAMFNRKLLLRYNIKYHEEYRYAQDYRMWVSCSKRARCTNIQKYLVKYRNHDEAVSTFKYDEQCDCALRIINEQLAALNLRLTQEVTPYHFMYLYLYKGYSVLIRKWIKRIIKANKEYKVYHHKKLKKVLWDRFSHTCIYTMKKADFKTRWYVIRTMSLRAFTGILRILILNIIAGKGGVYSPYEGTIKKRKIQLKTD